MESTLEKLGNNDFSKEMDTVLRIQFSSLINDLKLPNIIKSKLLTDAFSKHYFYVTLPFVISKLYPLTKNDENKLIKLSFYSYLYFSSVLCFDKYYDNQIDINKNKNLIRDFLFFVKEQALTGLLSLINHDSGFWNEFQTLKTIFFETSNKDNQIDINNYNDDTFFEIAKDKSILSYAYVYSLKYLFGKSAQEETILKGLDRYHIGFQIFDDYKDIKEDYISNQKNFFLSKINQKNIEIKDKSFEYLLKLSYIDNTISELLELALNYIRDSLVHDKN